MKEKEGDKERNNHQKDRATRKMTAWSYLQQVSVNSRIIPQSGVDLQLSNKPLWLGKIHDIRLRMESLSVYRRYICVTGFIHFKNTKKLQCVRVHMQMLSQYQRPEPNQVSTRNVFWSCYLPVKKMAKSL